MSEAKHTPGPCDMCYCGHLREIHFEAQSGPTGPAQACSAEGCACELFEKLDTLRAAAPELLEAADELLTSLAEEFGKECFCVKEWRGTHSTECPRKKLWAAIRKAKGE